MSVGDGHHGSAVLVHGTWSNPGDWQWVQRRLEDAGVQVAVPDLPSHRHPRAGLLEDAEEVRDQIRSLPAPVVVAGWSYGGAVLGIACAHQPTVARLVYVGAVPPRATVLTRDPDLFDSRVVHVDDEAGT